MILALPDGSVWSFRFRQEPSGKRNQPYVAPVIIIKSIIGLCVLGIIKNAFI